MLTRFHRTAGVFGLAIILSFGFTVANAQPSKMSCFWVRDWAGWKITPDAKSMYIRVSMNRIYRLDFRGACTAAQFGGSHLVTKSRGSSSICSPLDLDLRVSQGRHGIATPCIVSAITQLTPDEATALPKPLRP